jgi:hypothetical protein
MTRFLRFGRGRRGRATTTLTLLALIAASPLIGTAQAKAQDYLFTFNTNIGTGPDPSGGVINPWLQALVEDVDVIASPGLVKITLTPNFDDPKNFVSFVGFSIHPFVSTTQGVRFCTSLSPGYDCADSSFASAGDNGVGFPGGGVQIGFPATKSFDLVINAGTGDGGPGSQLGSNESAEFLINGGSGFAAANFLNAFNQIKDLEDDVDSKDGYNAVAKIQGLSCSPTSPSSCSGDSTEIAAGPPQIVDQETEKEPQEDVPSPLPLLASPAVV